MFISELQMYMHVDFVTRARFTAFMLSKATIR